MLSFVLYNCYIKYKDTIYRQIHGCAMGSKMAPTYACLTMGYIESQIYTIYRDINHDLSTYIEKHFLRFMSYVYIYAYIFINAYKHVQIHTLYMYIYIYICTYMHAKPFLWVLVMSRYACSSLRVRHNKCFALKMI